MGTLYVRWRYSMASKHHHCWNVHVVKTYWDIRVLNDYGLSRIINVGLFQETLEAVQEEVAGNTQRTGTCAQQMCSVQIKVLANDIGAGDYLVCSIHAKKEPQAANKMERSHTSRWKHIKPCIRRRESEQLNAHNGKSWMYCDLSCHGASGTSVEGVITLRRLIQWGPSFVGRNWGRQKSQRQLCVTCYMVRIRGRLQNSGTGYHADAKCSGGSKRLHVLRCILQFETVNHRLILQIRILSVQNSWGTVTSRSPEWLQIRQGCLFEPIRIIIWGIK